MSTNSEHIPPYVFLLVEAIENLQVRLSQAEHVLRLRPPVGEIARSQWLEVIMRSKDNFTKAVERKGPTGNIMEDIAYADLAGSISRETFGE